MKRYIFELLNQASTWRGIVMLITSLGIVFNAEQQSAVIACGLAFSGLIGVFLSDNLSGDKNAE